MSFFYQTDLGLISRCSNRRGLGVGS